jgi:hypothetical protein
MFRVLFCLTVIGLATCDPMYKYNFYVNNGLLMTIKTSICIKTGKNGAATDAFTIKSGNSTLLYTDENWGNVRAISKSTDSVSSYSTLDSLRVYINDSLAYVQSPLDFSQWKHSGVDSGPGTSNYTFVVDTSVIK